MNILILCIQILLFTLKYVTAELIDKEIGAACKEVDDKTWTCQILSQCPQVGDFKRARPIICGFQGKEPVICCPPNQEANEEKNIDLDYEIKDLTKGEEYSENGTDSVASRPENSSTSREMPTSIYKCVQYSVSLCLPKTGAVFVRKRRDIKNTILVQTHLYTTSFSFLVRIGYGKKDNISWKCGGSIISEKWVLSAAHCATSDVGRARWVLPKTLYSPDGFPLDYLNISMIVIHPQFKEPDMYHDIALFQLQHQLLFNQYVQPVCLHNLKETPDSSILAGWGTTEFGGPASDILRYVDMKINDFQTCREIYENSTLLPRGIDDEIMFCSGDYKKGACSGDSGGPLVYKSSMCLQNQIGLVSFGRRCGVYPGVSTRVSYYVPWIESIVWPEE